MISKKNIDDLVIRLAILFPSTVLLQGIPGLGWINKAIVAVLILLMLWQIIDQLNVFVSCMVCGELSVIALLLSNGTYLRLQDVFFFPLFVLYCLYWANRSAEFETVLKKNLDFGRFGVVLWFFLVVISMPFPTSFVHEALNTVFFRSFSSDAFRLASSCILIMVLLHILAYYKNTAIFLLEAIPMLVIFSAGTRVYLLVGAGFFFLSLYLLCKNKQIFWMSLIPIILIMTVAVLNSSIVDKFTLVALSQQSFYGNFLDAFTSGRTVFWGLELDAFGELPLWKQLIGNGLSFAYEVTGIRYVRSIWSHNDFVHMLMSYGWIGLGLYFFCFFRIAARFRKTYSLKWLPWIGAVGLCMGNAFINGYYFYSAAMLATPFMFYAMSLDRGKQKQ